ncbi:MAG: 30S ribosomal protein S16 [Candidatus Aminicenantes bacterium]|nr:MAG: 30S ribosomal protein S16 [Candidatus Aminicenantes bacterium]
MVVIRLTRGGTKHRPYYRIVAIDKRRPRESRYIDLIGHYNPMREQPEIKVDFNKYNEWIKKGAKPSHTVKSLIKKVKSDN